MKSVFRQRYRIALLALVTLSIFVGLTILQAAKVESNVRDRRAKDLNQKKAQKAQPRNQKIWSADRSADDERDSTVAVESPEESLFRLNSFQAESITAGLPGFDETEPNNTFATAQPLGGNDVKVKGHIFPVGDVDFYSFTASAGDRVYAATMTTAAPLLGSSNSVLDILSTDGVTVLETDNDDGGFSSTSSTIAGVTIPAPGTYYVRVTESGNDSTLRPYDLYLRVQSGSPMPESESNNTTGTADPLPASGWASGAIAATSDVDIFSISLAAGDTIYASLDLDPERNGVTWNGALAIGLFGDASNTFEGVDDASVASPNSEAYFMTVKNAGTYFVRVRHSTNSGAATFTYNLSVSVIPQAVKTCTTHTSTNVPKTIPDPGVVTSTLTIPGNPRIEQLKVFINLTHDFILDLDVTLTAPDGNVVGLFINDDANGNMMDVILDDDAALPISSIDEARVLTAKPGEEFRLSWFKGQNAGGTWTLTIYDDADGDGGTLNSWGLIVCTEPPLSCSKATEQIIYSSDFEANDGSFTHAGTQDEWQRGLPAFGPITTCNSGVNCWKTDLDNTYNPNSNQDLFSPNINLVGKAGPIFLRWAQKYQLEDADFDGAFVEVQEVGGSGLTRKVWQWLDTTMETEVGEDFDLLAEAAGWGLIEADISDFAGKIIRLRFHLQSDGIDEYAGYAIDDVSVSACVVATAPPDVTISKSGPPSVACGNTINYSLTASNIGAGGATGVTVTDDLPDCLTNVQCSVTPAGAGTCTLGAGNTLTVNIPALASSGSVTINITATVGSGCCGLISNQASISAAGDSNTGNNNSAVVSTSVSCPFACSLSPATATNAVNTSHTVTITVTQCGGAVSGRSVSFNVTGRNTASGSGTTNAQGQASFTYTDTGNAMTSGSDTITACVSDGKGGCVTTCTATKNWSPQTCTITCPKNITVSNTPGQCGANVNYPPATGTAACGQVTCSPATGSLFPIGTTTVTCKSNNGAGPDMCSFTVTVADTSAPSITCPANITAVTGQTCPPVTGVMINFATPSLAAGTLADNCQLPVGAKALCSPASGSTFPVGTTTVTCTATDAAGNTATCSFTVTAFNACLQDDARPGQVVLFNTFTGEYRYCCGGTVRLAGRGTIFQQGCVFTLQHNTPDRRVFAKIDFTARRGNGSLQIIGGPSCTISDTDTRNNSCQCAAP